MPQLLRLGLKDPQLHFPTGMFDTLSDKLQATLGDLRGHGTLSEEDLSKAMREIRLALLEADVNFQVVKDFVARVKERAAGVEVTKSLTPGQEVVKIVHDELTTIMGQGGSKLAFSGRPPTIILLAGLQGSGKTTAAAKLALLLRKEGKAPALVAADLQRPAAIDQLEQLGKQVQIPVYLDRSTKDAVKVAKEGLDQARAQGRDVLIVDTAGRLHIDEELMNELAAVRKELKPHNILLVLDSMTGQDAVSVAEAFAERIDFDGIVLTKLDGDARGGAALSVKAVTDKPVKLASTGEKLDQLEYFHPDRMASRILGMGDVLTLIERAEAAAEEDEQAALEKRLMQGRFTFEDFLQAYKMMRKMGPMKSLIGMIPGMGKQLQGVDVDERQLSRVEAMVLSMTAEERRNPEIIKGSRRARIAAGSGTSVQQVNQLLQMRKQMEKMMKQMGRGKMPNLQSMVAQQRR
jgi:signal recognition particle subunit SRP54